MNPELAPSRIWEIDKRLQSLIGCPIRVRSDSFIPTRLDGKPPKHRIELKHYILPDGSYVDYEPVYGEGILKEFVRYIGVVFVTLDPLPFEDSADGRVLFRGFPAIILRAPVTVRFHPSHFVEKLPLF